jgi:DNA-binding winged helix-turn-helix (wHTH) protein/tetratricopeptide (TPR) repeat protein
MADTQRARVLRFGPFEADLGNRQVFKNGLLVSLRGQAFDVLALLLENPGHLVTREQLRARLWPSGTIVEFDHSIHTAVTKLREALGEDADHPRFIATVPRHGYRFIASVSTPAPTAPESAASSVSPPSSASGTAAVPQRFRFRWFMLGVLVVAAVGLAGILSWPDLLHLRSIVPYSPEDRRMTFAILPFQAPRDDALGQEMARSTFEVMETAFEHNALWGHVAPRRSVDEAVAQLASLKDIAKSLDVHFLIRGRIENTPPDYTVNVLLVDGASERVLGTRSFLLPAIVAARPRHVDGFDAFFGMLDLAVVAEVNRALHIPVDALDVRDLSFRAYSEWRNHRGAQAKQGYTSATELLKRALALAPDDMYATYLTVKINLCDCAQDWSSNVEEQRAIGAAALEKLLGADPSNLVALKFKVLLLQLRGRFEESLVIADTILQREPDEVHVLDWKAGALLRLGHPREAQPIADALAGEVPDKWPWLEVHAADIHYALADYVAAAQLARGAVARMSEAGLRNSVDGTIRLTLAASEAKLGHPDRAAAALADLQRSVPEATTLAAIRKWMNPLADLYGFQPLFDGLRLAGVPD